MRSAETRSEKVGSSETLPKDFPAERAKTRTRTRSQRTLSSRLTQRCLRQAAPKRKEPMDVVTDRTAVDGCVFGLGPLSSHNSRWRRDQRCGCDPGCHMSKLLLVSSRSLHRFPSHQKKFQSSRIKGSDSLGAVVKENVECWIGLRGKSSSGSGSLLVLKNQRPNQRRTGGKPSGFNLDWVGPWWTADPEAEGVFPKTQKTGTCLALCIQGWLRWGGGGLGGGVVRSPDDAQGLVGHKQSSRPLLHSLLRPLESDNQQDFDLKVVGFPSNTPNSPTETTLRCSRIFQQRDQRSRADQSGPPLVLLLS